MSQPPTTQATEVPRIGTLRLADLAAALAAGWRDFRAAPFVGLAFSAVYVLGGLALWFFLNTRGALWWAIPLTLGFPLLAPFAAVGLYETSRRLEAREPLDMNAIIGVVLAERRRQLPWMGALIVIWFVFWMFVSHTIFALFLGLGASSGFTTLAEVLLTPQGMTMLAVQAAVGGAFALVLFAATVVSLPLLLEAELDFVTAMIVSFQTVGRNPLVMLTWAALIAVTLAVAMLPAFLGLFLALPVLGHATWHLYRRALYWPV